MKSKKLTLICSIGLILVLLTSLVLSACAKEEAAAPAAPAAPAKPAPTTPAPAKPAPTTPAPAKPAPAPSAEVFKWKFQDNVPVGPGAHWQVGLWFNDWVEKHSNGRLIITQYPAGQIVKAADYLDALRENTIQMATTYGGYYKGFMPEGGIECGLPGLIRSANELNYLYWDLGLIDILREVYAEYGAYYYEAHTYGQVPIWATRPLRTMDDFQGLKIRAVGEAATMLTNMGCAVTYIPHEESYMALQLGTIEAYSTGVTAWEDFNHYEVTSYLMQPPVLGVGVDNRSFSLKAMNELPEDLRLFLESQAPVMSWKHTYGIELDEEDLMGRIGELGGELVYYDDEVIDFMTQAGIGFLDEYAEKSEGCAKIAKIIKDFMKEKGRIE